MHMQSKDTPPPLPSFCLLADERSRTAKENHTAVENVPFGTGRIRGSGSSSFIVTQLLCHTAFCHVLCGSPCYHLGVKIGSQLWNADHQLSNDSVK